MQKIPLTQRVTFLGAISILVLVFSMLMIVLSEFNLVNQNSNAVYFSMISTIVGLWTPTPRKPDENTTVKQVLPKAPEQVPTQPQFEEYEYYTENV